MGEGLDEEQDSSAEEMVSHRKHDDVQAEAPLTINSEPTVVNPARGQSSTRHVLARNLGSHWIAQSKSDDIDTEHQRRLGMQIKLAHIATDC